MSAKTALRGRRARGKSLLASTLAHHHPASADSASSPGGSGADAPNPVFTDVERRHALIEHCAYLRAERRGFEPGHELEDWYEAEREIDARLFRGETPPL